MAEDALIQAKAYAQLLEAPYAIATNGTRILLIDMDRGSVRRRDEFPTLAELRAGLPPEPEPVPVMRGPAPVPRKEPNWPARIMWSFLLGLGPAFGIADWWSGLPDRGRLIVAVTLGVWASITGLASWRYRANVIVVALVVLCLAITIACLLFIVALCYGSSGCSSASRLCPVPTGLSSGCPRPPLNP